MDQLNDYYVNLCGFFFDYYHRNTDKILENVEMNCQNGHLDELVLVDDKTYRKRKWKWICYIRLKWHFGWVSVSGDLLPIYIDKFPWFRSIDTDYKSKTKAISYPCINKKIPNSLLHFLRMFICQVGELSFFFVSLGTSIAIVKN